MQRRVIGIPPGKRSQSRAPLAAAFPQLQQPPQEGYQDRAGQWGTRRDNRDDRVLADAGVVPVWSEVAIVPRSRYRRRGRLLACARHLQDAWAAYRYR